MFHFQIRECPMVKCRAVELPCNNIKTHYINVSGKMCPMCPYCASSTTASS